MNPDCYFRRAMNNAFGFGGINSSLVLGLL